MPDWTGGASGAVSGATFGSSFGPVGTVAGGILGGATGLFGGNDERSKAERQRQALLDRLKKRDEELLDQTPTESAFYQAGTEEMREQQERQAQRDQARNVRAGGSSEMAIAQSAERQRQFGQGQRQLAGDAERYLNDRQARALGRLLNVSREQAALGRRRRQNKNQQIKSAVKQGTKVLDDMELPDILGSRPYG